MMLNQALHVLITQYPIALPSSNPNPIPITPYHSAGSERHHQHTPLARNPFDTSSPPYATPTTDTEPNTSDIMCLWERLVYRCGHAPHRPTRMQYSCEIWKRHVFGDCVYVEGRSLVSHVHHPNICPDCQESENGKQREKWRRTVMKDRKSGGRGSSH